MLAIIWIARKDSCGTCNAGGLASMLGGNGGGQNSYEAGAGYESYGAVQNVGNVGGFDIGRMAGMARIVRLPLAIALI
jgi:hypothetical protein